MGDEGVALAGVAVSLALAAAGCEAWLKLRNCSKENISSRLAVHFSRCFVLQIVAAKLTYPFRNFKIYLNLHSIHRSARLENQGPRHNANTCKALGRTAPARLWTCENGVARVTNARTVVAAPEVALLGIAPIATDLHTAANVPRISLLVVLAWW